MSADGSEGYGRFPRSLLTSGQWAALGHADKAALGVLIARANPAGLAWPGIDTIAAEAGIARGNAIRAIGRLIKAGLVERAKSGGGRGKPTTYRVFAVAEVGRNRRAGASESGEKLTRRERETDARAHTNRRAGASRKEHEEKRKAPAPEPPAAARRVRAWLTEDRKHRLTAARQAMTTEAVATMRGAGFFTVAAAVDGGVLTVEELDKQGPEALAGLIVERIGAQGGASVRSDA